MSDELYTEVRLLPQASVIDLAGDVTSFADTRLHSSFNDASASGKTHIILNYARVDYINSALRPGAGQGGSPRPRPWYARRSAVDGGANRPR
jgi:hypothetical protein